MKNILLFVVLAIAGCWAVPKPMESIANYNILMVHGAYGAEKGFENSASEYLTDSITSSYRRFFEDSLEAADPQFFEMYQGMPSIMKDGIWNSNIPKEMYDSIERVHYAFDAGYDILSAYDRDEFLGNATLGGYDSDDRITKWLSMNVFEEPDIGKERNPRNSYIYNWRSFSNPANSSYNNAYELADRTWNKGNKPFHQGGFGHRRALMEEAQEVKAEFVNDSGKVSYGQAALEIMRHHPDLYRQLASRYILIGHSMGGVVSREYVQGNFYNGDVDKFVTLDSPHDGTGALNALLDLDEWKHQLGDGFSSSVYAGMSAAGIALLVVGKTPSVIYPALITMAVSFGGDALQQVIKELALNLYFKDNGYDYRYDDGLVAYIDPEKEGSGINKLKERAVDSTFPMARLLGAENSMTFTDPNSSDPRTLLFKERNYS